MIRADDIHSLTSFTRNAKTLIQKVKATKHPLAITINGGAEVIIQDAESYQAMVDELEAARFQARLVQGLNDLDKGLSTPAATVYENVRRKYRL